MPIRSDIGYKALLLAGLILNVVLIIYVYFLVDGGPASVQQHGDWSSILNEVPMTVLFFLAAVFKPYLMVWSRCRKNPGVVLWAGSMMLATTVISGAIIFLAEAALTKDLSLYLNWALLWGVSAYYVLLPQRHASDE